MAARIVVLWRELLVRLPLLRRGLWLLGKYFCGANFWSDILFVEVGIVAARKVTPLSIVVVLYCARRSW